MHGGIIKPCHQLVEVKWRLSAGHVWQQGLSSGLELAVQKVARINRCVVIPDMVKALTEEVGVKSAISSCLLEACRRSIDSLLGGCESASSQQFDLLSVTYFGVGINHFLSCFQKLLSELPEL